MRIRPVEQAEVEQLRALRLRALLDAPTAFASTHAVEVERTLAEWMWWIVPPSITFVAADGETWHGLAVGRMDADEPVADVFSMWVAPEARGQGLAAALLERVIEWAWEGGASTVRLAVTEDNGAAEALYRRRGFQATGRRESLRLHAHLDCAYMELKRPNEP